MWPPHSGARAPIDRDVRDLWPLTAAAAVPTVRTVTIESGSTTDPAEIPDPAKMLRLGSMIKNLLDEVHAMPLDEGGRARLVEIHARALAEVEANLSEPLRRELTAIAQPLRTGSVVSDAELRIAEAQLVGWLEGLLQGVQFAAMIHQAASSSQR